jgi:hypothetical protein
MVEIPCRQDRSTVCGNQDSQRWLKLFIRVPKCQVPKCRVLMCRLLKSWNPRFVGVVWYSGYRWQLIKQFRGIGFQGFLSEPQEIFASYEIAKYSRPLDQLFVILRVEKVRGHSYEDSRNEKLWNANSWNANSRNANSWNNLDHPTRGACGNSQNAHELGPWSQAEVISKKVQGESAHREEPHSSVA